MAAGFFAVAIQAVIARQIVGDVEPGDPPTVVPVQAGNVNVGIVEGADVKLDSPGVVFLALNGQRGSALVAERPPHPRRGLVDLAFPFREPDLVGLENYQRDDRCAVVPPAIRTVAMAGDHRLSHDLETHRATEAAAAACFRSFTHSCPPLIGYSGRDDSDNFVVTKLGFLIFGFQLSNPSP